MGDGTSAPNSSFGSWTMSPSSSSRSVDHAHGNARIERVPSPRAGRFFYPQSYMIVGQPGRLVYADALYLSITVLTSTGFGDVTPLARPARGVCMIEQIAGALFVAILIARLAGVYPPRESYIDDKAAR